MDRLYTYATLESWNLQIEFFATEEALADFFIENWGNAEESYEYMLDEELDVYYDCAEKENFYSLRTRKWVSMNNNNCRFLQDECYNG